MCSFIILLGIIVTIAYMGMIYHSTVLLLGAYIFLLCGGIAFIYLQIQRFMIKARLEVPVGISEVGKENLVKITLRKKGYLPLLSMKGNVVVRETITGYEKSYWMHLSAAIHGKNEYTTTVVLPKMGNYEVYLRKLRFYDLSGFFYQTKRGKTLGKIQILPKLHDIPVRLTSAVKHFYGEADVYDEHCSGHDNSELFQVRPYQMGDRIQRVHWKLTAKEDNLMVKEHSLPKACPVVFFLDFHPGKGQHRRGAAFVELAASISFSMMDGGCPHYVVWFEEKERDCTRIRVDDEESLFYFLSLFMNIQWCAGKEDIVDAYKEKYKMEPYVWALTLDENLVLRRSGEVLHHFTPKGLDEVENQTEILL